MSTPKMIKQLVKEISVLSSSLSDAVPRGSKDDKIWSGINTMEGDIPPETFNHRFDALFGEDCWDPGGHLHYIRQGKLGMGLVISYLLKIHWTHDFPLDLVELKLQHLIDELRHLQQAVVPCPAQTVNPAAKLKDTANTEAPQLSFQRKAVQDFHSRQAKKNDPPPVSSTPDANPHVPSSIDAELAPQNKCSNSSINDSNTEDEIVDQPLPSKKKHATATTSQRKSKHVTSATVETVDDVDMTDAEENIFQGYAFSNHGGHLCKLKCLLI
ncbi:hypothetical protein F5148DRAFT_1153436 [Russula earlei]|uniref:Uncharacterized protein n=1 Tax=Russula earlei TaxID=71964 RepID=A0ACC0TUA2_9AGAM|nr:hypothetical protein F5148DRAFT_1153436 [Russula earlei]